MASRGAARTASGPRDWGRWPWLWVAVMALAAAGCSGTSRSPSGSSSPSLPKTTLTACTVDGLAANCGSVRVPLDWTHPGGPVMPLRVVVLPATGTSHPAAPLFDLAGWGSSATDDVSGLAQTFRQLNLTMDLVFVAQRGTSGAGPQNCPELLATGPPLRAAVSRCLASVSRDPRHDTTASAARDLDQARKALGYDKINIYGASYGVSMGLAYLQAYGEHVRTAVFQSGSLLNVPLFQLNPIHLQQAFDQVVARCAAIPACGRSYHPAADLAAVAARVRAHPVRVTFAGPGGQQETLTVTLPVLFTAVEDYLSSSATAVLLPADLHALARGQWEQVFRQYDSALGQAILAATANQTQLQEITIRCGDAWAAMNPAQLNQQNSNSLFTPYMAGTAAWQQQICALWPHDPGVSGAVRSTAPVVFINGTADPTDPPANVAAAPRTMPNALLAVVPGRTHIGVDVGCVRPQIIAFIQAGVPANRASWAACTRALQHELPAFPPAP